MKGEKLQEHVVTKKQSKSLVLSSALLEAPCEDIKKNNGFSIEIAQSANYLSFNLEDLNSVAEPT